MLDAGIFGLAILSFDDVVGRSFSMKLYPHIHIGLIGAPSS